jgi:ABC-type lipoprotein export system ATPase subunit
MVAVANSPASVSSTITQLWVPVFFFGHLFAGYWIVRGAILTNTPLGAALRRLFSRRRKNLPHTETEEWAAARAQSLDKTVLAEATEAATTPRSRPCEDGAGPAGRGAALSRAISRSGRPRVGRGLARCGAARRARGRCARGRGGRAHGADGARPPAPAPRPGRLDGPAGWLRRARAPAAAAAGRAANSGRAPAAGRCDALCTSCRAPAALRPHRPPTPARPQPPSPVPNSISGGKPSFDGRRSSGASGANRSVAEVERIELEWQGLSCCYRTPHGNKWVLKEIYGAANPGEMQVRGSGWQRGRAGCACGRMRPQARRVWVHERPPHGRCPARVPTHARTPHYPMQALLGPSGAGKSTLMDMLAQRKSTGQLGGTVLVDGLPADSSFIRRTAYVPQHDNFVPVMTTLEVMQFYAGMMLPRDWTKARRAARVDEVLTDMGLAHAHKTLVGGQSPGGLLHRGLSGGERKRLSIGTGILAAPSVVFLDEPTTGLDSFAALTVRARAGGTGAGSSGSWAAGGCRGRLPAAAGSGGGRSGGMPGPHAAATAMRAHHERQLTVCRPTPCPGHGLHEAHGARQRAHRDRRHPPAPLRHLVHV